MSANLGIALLLLLLPFVLIAGTSYLKLSLVLAILRSALGAAEVPPTAVLSALAAVLSLFVMAPIGEEMLAGLEALPARPSAATDPYGLAQARAAYDAVSPPLVRFLQQNTPDAELDFFRDLDPLGPSATAPREPGLRQLLPAFASSELVDALLIGFLVYLPFLVIDLIVANSLLALGLQAVAPLAFSLPLKLLLFVAVDGWHLLLSGLLVTYSV